MEAPTSDIHMSDSAVPSIDALHTDFDTLATKHESALQSLLQARERIRNVERQCEAAEAEAQAAREAWRQLLHANGGTVNKEIQKLRANERSAYTLIEELNEYLSELEHGRRWLELELAETFASCEARSAQLRKSLSDTALREAMDICAPVLAEAFQLVKSTTGEDATRQFHVRLEAALNQHAEQAQKAADEILAGSTVDGSQLPPLLRNSHMARLQLRKELEAMVQVTANHGT